jgi:hypothetical protein
MMAARIAKAAWRPPPAKSASRFIGIAGGVSASREPQRRHRSDVVDVWPTSWIRAVLAVARKGNTRREVDAADRVIVDAQALDDAGLKPSRTTSAFCASL